MPAKISIHTLRVEGDQQSMDMWMIGIISIHTLRVEGDYIHPGLIQ